MGRGLHAEWIGSVSWDADPWNMPDSIISARNKDIYRSAVQSFIRRSTDGYLPADGWPWFWDDSRTTDYAYTYFAGRAYYTHTEDNSDVTFWKAYDEDLNDYKPNHRHPCVFPSMKSKVKPGPRSGGFLILQVRQ